MSMAFVWISVPGARCRARLHGYDEIVEAFYMTSESRVVGDTPLPPPSRGQHRACLASRCSDEVAPARATRGLKRSAPGAERVARAQSQFLWSVSAFHLRGASKMKDSVAASIDAMTNTLDAGSTGVDDVPRSSTTHRSNCIRVDGVS